MEPNRSWKKPEKLSDTELEAAKYYAQTGCSSTEIENLFGLTKGRTNKVIYFGLMEAKAIARERKMIDNIEQCGIENELVTINNYDNNGKKQNSTSGML